MMRFDLRPNSRVFPTPVFPSLTAKDNLSFYKLNTYTREGREVNALCEKDKATVPHPAEARIRIE